MVDVSPANMKPSPHTGLIMGHSLRAGPTLSQQ